MRSLFLPLLTILVLPVIAQNKAQLQNSAERMVISLDGQWQIAEGSMEVMPETFDRTVPVPGLVDLAVPAFEQVGVASPLRKAFWYKKTFTVSGTQRAVAMLKIAKAQFGMKVWLNGIEAGEEVGCYAPGSFEVTGSLRYDVENTLIVRVGTFKDALPAWAPFLLDGEVSKWPPGIYDSVSLSLMDSPYIVRIQVAPDIEKGLITVQLRLRNVSGARIRFPVKLSVREWKSGRSSGTAEMTANLPGIGERIFTTSMKIGNAHLWSPEDPFLYVLSCETEADKMETRFGMREFRYDPESGRAMLNGQPYYLRGCNFRMFSFFEDPDRGALPWDREWVRKFLTKPKNELHWNSGRVMFCRLPQFWYDLADEIGWLLQDEWPLWKLKPEWTSAELTRQFKQWMEESWNHPSIVVWDACNETLDARTTEVIENVRGLDLSNRPWDNSWRRGPMAGDPAEFHAYSTCPWSAFETYDPPWDLADFNSPLERIIPAPLGPVIINEIDLFWIRRDGSSWKGVFEPIYNNYAGPNATLEQRRECQAYLSAAVAEYWRARRDVAGIHGSFYLNYNVPDGLTSSPFLDVTNQVLEPHFVDYTKNAYSPLAVMIDDYTRHLAPGSRREYRIIVTNDDPKSQKGVLELRIVGKDDQVLGEASRNFSVKPWEQAQYVLPITLPGQPGEYRMVARLCPGGSEVVLSRRNIRVVTPEEAIRLNNLAEGCAVTASGELAGFPAKFATDGKRSTHWSSVASDPQWLTVDLGRERNIGAVSIDWSSSIWVMKMANSRYTKQYEVQVSSDNLNWAAVAKVTAGNSGRDLHEFPQTTARYVRIYATARRERSMGGTAGESQNEDDAQLVRVGTQAGGVREWQMIARHENEIAAIGLENREGFGGFPREGYDIWDLGVYEK